MSKDPFSKLQSSLSLEDLLAQPSSRNTHNWLITYLDVFVLIVMLVITLITLSDIKTEKQAAIKPSKAIKCPPVAPAVTCPSPVITENTTVKNASPIEPKTETKPNIPNIENNSTENSIVSTTPPEIKSTAEASFNAIPNLANAQPTSTPTDESKLQQQLAKTIDAFGLNKAVNIKVTQGYAQLEIQDSVLFKSSEADLTASGGVLLKRLVPLLKQAVGLILIEGHTDDIPIKTSRFTSNWELGASRATSVLHFLILQQIDSSRLRAITYADTMPIADNSTQEGREKNRRVNILIKLSGE
jgi:chemotaxis protein MotB